MAFTTSFSAAEQVFGTTELLEQILLQCGERETWMRLFIVQRVSRRFQAVIQSSPSLRSLMYLDKPLREITSHAQLQSYRNFFVPIQGLLFPFWCHLRQGPETLILALNISLFWREESPGVWCGTSAGLLDGKKAIEKLDSWRKLVVPCSSRHRVELHCCGYPVNSVMREGITLGELADEAIAAGRDHLGGLEPVRFYG